MKEIETAIQMRFSDTDMLGHVNNINIQNYFEVAKCEYFTRVLDLPLNWTKEGFIIKSTMTTYESQTRIGENLVVHTGVESIGTKSMLFAQRLLNADTGELKAFHKGVMVAFDFEKQESIAIPAAWRDAIGLP